MFLTWILLSFIPALVGFILSIDILSGPLLKTAKSFDDDTMSGIPIALTLVQSCVLKNSSSSISVSKQKTESEVRTLHKQLEDLEKKLARKSRASEKMAEAAVTVNAKSQEELQSHYQKVTSDAFDQAKPIVGLL